MKKTKTMIVLLSLLIFFAAGSFAQPAQRMMRAARVFDRAPDRILHFLKANQVELGITESQMEQIQNLVFSHEEKMLNTKNANSLQRLELQKLMQDRENLDYDRIEAVLSKTSAARQEMFIERLKQRDEISKILTPEQRDALKTMVKEGIEKRFQRMEERGDRYQAFRRFPQLRRRIIR